MWIERCSDWRCRRPYQVNEFRSEESSLFDAELRPEKISCPHCGNSETRWSLSMFLVHALSPEEEARFQQISHTP